MTDDTHHTVKKLDTNTPSTVKKSNTPTVKKLNTSIAQLVKLQRLVRRKKNSPFAHITHTKKRAYVTAIAITGMHCRACDLAGISLTTPRTAQWRADRELQDALAVAREAAADNIEDALYHRAVEGVTKPTGWYKGAPGGYVQEYDTTAAIFLLKGIRPEKYADRLDMRSIVGKIDFARLPDAVIDRIAQSSEDPSVIVATWASEVMAKGQPLPPGLLPDDAAELADGPATDSQSVDVDAVTEDDATS